MAKKGTTGGPWLLGMSVCEVNVILSLESALLYGQVAKIGLNCPFDLRSGSRHEK